MKAPQLICTLFLIFRVFLFFGQTTPETEDTSSLPSFYFEEPEEKKAKFIFAFDSRNSFVRRDRAKVFGIRIGKEVIGSHRWGIGAYGLVDTDSLMRDIIIENTNGEETSIEGRLNFNYLAFFWEEILYSDKKWELTFPLQIGLGSARIEYLDPVDSLRKETNSSGMLVLEPTLYGQYKIWRWAGVGLGLGYRAALINNDILDERLSSPIYAIRIKVLLGELFKMLVSEPIKEKRARKLGVSFAPTNRSWPY